MNAPAIPVVASGSRRRRMSAGVWCLVLLGLTLAALGHVAVQARQYEVALELGRERKRNDALRAEQRKLEAEIARLRDPGRIEREAREKLNMGLPAPTAIRVPR